MNLYVSSMTDGQKKPTLADCGPSGPALDGALNGEQCWYLGSRSPRLSALLPVGFGSLKSSNHYLSYSAVKGSMPRLCPAENLVEIESNSYLIVISVQESLLPKAPSGEI